MAPISGTYRLVSSDNLLAECEATFAGALSPADIKAIAAPDNRWTFHIKEKANGLIFKMEYREAALFDTQPSPPPHRRRIKTEEKAKVVAAIRGAELIQFLATPAILH